jgi:decaprenylphospho-beta-D-erythro-pentofuranosid-2-ulose 2-reductase
VNQKIAIIGATSAMAEHCARLWVSESPKTMVLLGRDRIKTDRVAQDLRVRSPQSDITVETIDFTDHLQIKDWVNHICSIGVPDIVLIAHGTLADQIKCQQDLALNHSTLYINGVSPVLFGEAFISHMLNIDRGTLAIIGSVAGDRGRKSNYVYGAAKGLVTRYTQGLQHRLNKTNVKVVLIKPGPTATPMTSAMAHKDIQLADVKLVARDIVNGIAKSSLLVYTPAKWRIIMMVFRHLPNFIFNKLDV